jgi:hypothetical protein
MDYGMIARIFDIARKTRSLSIRRLGFQGRLAALVETL